RALVAVVVGTEVVPVGDSGWGGHRGAVVQERKEQGIDHGLCPAHPEAERVIGIWGHVDALIELRLIAIGTVWLGSVDEGQPHELRSPYSGTLHDHTGGRISLFFAPPGHSAGIEPSRRSVVEPRV